MKDQTLKLAGSEKNSLSSKVAASLKENAIPYLFAAGLMMIPGHYIIKGYSLLASGDELTTSSKESQRNLQLTLVESHLTVGIVDSKLQQTEGEYSDWILDLQEFERRLAFTKDVDPTKADIGAFSNSTKNAVGGIGTALARETLETNRAQLLSFKARVIEGALLIASKVHNDENVIEEIESVRIFINERSDVSHILTQDESQRAEFNEMLQKGFDVSMMYLDRFKAD